MDFIEGLPRSRGRTTIPVVVGSLTKFAHFISLAHPFTAKSVVAALIDNVHKLYGLPRIIVSDRDGLFTSEFWGLQGSKLHLSTSYHPQSDGQSKVVNRCLETYLRCFCSHKPQDWNKWFLLGSVLVQHQMA